ncbi:hypothetical protein [Streptomyces sp. NBC_01336]|uniref:hypothetical protein n=1 Tax=unclassified Streptomyces TaxID=2593676 RepID=UPI002E12DD2E|nr:hypothetical protein OG471_34885 [Streptomyces sp. NBC_01336]
MLVGEGGEDRAQLLGEHRTVRPGHVQHGIVARHQARGGLTVLDGRPDGADAEDDE